MRSLIDSQMADYLSAWALPLVRPTRPIEPALPLTQLASLGLSRKLVEAGGREQHRGAASLKHMPDRARNQGKTLDR